MYVDRATLWACVATIAILIAVMVGFFYDFFKKNDEVSLASCHMTLTSMRRLKTA